MSAYDLTFTSYDRTADMARLMNEYHPDATETKNEVSEHSDQDTYGNPKTTYTQVIEYQWDVKGGTRRYHVSYRNGRQINAFEDGKRA